VSTAAGFLIKFMLPGICYYRRLSDSLIGSFFYWEENGTWGFPPNRWRPPSLLDIWLGLFVPMMIDP